MATDWTALAKLGAAAFAKDSPPTLIADLRAQGLSVSVSDDEQRIIIAPPGKLSDAQRERIKRDKQAIIECLQRESRRKRLVVAPPPAQPLAAPERATPLCWVMFPDDLLCPEWSELAAWARTAPAAAFRILPHRAKMYATRESLRTAIVNELTAANDTLLVGLIYELRTLKEQWERH